MEWTDSAFILSRRPFGEGGAIATLLTRQRGRQSGHLRGARSHAASLEPGTEVSARWLARQSDQLGTLTLEPVHSALGALMADPLRLNALAGAMALVDLILPEHEPHPRLFVATQLLIERLEAAPEPASGWGPVLVHWELGLLAEIGFGLDLQRCAVTGRPEGLTHVSPRSGRAVTAAAAGDWAPRLLPLPGFLAGPDRRAAPPSAADLLDGLALTGYFLERHATAAHHRPLPAARRRLVEALSHRLPATD